MRLVFSVYRPTPGSVPFLERHESQHLQRWPDHFVGNRCVDDTFLPLDNDTIDSPMDTNLLLGVIVLYEEN